MRVRSCARTFAIPWTIAGQAPRSTGILQVRVLEWVAVSFSSRDDGWSCWTVSCPTLQTDSEVYAGLEVVPQGPTAGNGPTQDFSANGLNP